MLKQQQMLLEKKSCLKASLRCCFEASLLDTVIEEDKAKEKSMVQDCKDNSGRVQEDFGKILARHMNITNR